MHPLLDRVENEIAAGRRWRAKEIIRGNISVRWPDPRVVERYGQILLDSGEQLEAGKYLFVSGVRKAEYAGAIALFLKRYGRRGSATLVAQFPTTFRRLSFSDLPEELQREMAALGVDANAFGRRPNATSAPSAFGTVIATIATLAILVCLIVGVVVAFRTIVSWVSQVGR